MLIQQMDVFRQVTSLTCQIAANDAMQVQKFLSVLVNDTNIAQLQLQVSSDLGQWRWDSIDTYRTHHNAIMQMLCRLAAFN